MTQEERKKFIDNINYAKKHKPELFNEIKRNFTSIRLGFEMDKDGNIVGLRDLVGGR